jgi:YgiT-type zinc finger domain-containing protein
MINAGETCPICDKGILHEEYTTEIFNYRGYTFTIENYGSLACSFCGERLVMPKTIRETDPILKNFRKMVDLKISKKLQK